MQMSNVYPRLSPINRFSYSFRKVRVCAGACLVCLTMAAQAAPISVTNLVTNDQSAHSATITDPLLRNAWGVSHSPTSPFWVSDNATGLSTLYSVNPATNAIVKVPLEVSIPGDGSVTGQAFNPTANFNGDRFLFVSEDGTISGWRMPLGTTAETLVPGSPANVYKGVDFVNVGGNSYLYAANFRNGTIDIVKGNPGAPNLTGNFTDPSLPVGYAPFNIENIGGSVFVTYAVQSADKKDDVAGAGNGIINEFDINGNFVRRVATGGTLNAPWGMALAPATFGFGNALLVGNFGDGTINVFDFASDAFLGQLLGNDGNPVSIDGLWGLIPGNGAGAGNINDIYFTAGPDDERNGLFGVLAAATVPEPGILALLFIGSIGLFLGSRKRHWVGVC